MIAAYINIKTRVLHKNAYDVTPITGLELRYTDNPVFNLHFMLPTRDPRGPYAINRFQSATIGMSLLDSSGTAVATQAVWTEIVPATTAPTITRVTSGDATHGEYDKIALASEPGSGFLGIVLSAGAITSSGGTSATARVYPGITQEAEVAAAYAAMSGAPYIVAYPSLTEIEIHGQPVATPPRVTAVNVSNLQYLFGWSASLNLNNANVQAASDIEGDTPQVRLVVTLTPSGGAIETVLRLPISLFS